MSIISRTQLFQRGGVNPVPDSPLQGKSNLTYFQQSQINSECTSLSARVGTFTARYQGYVRLLFHTPLYPYNFLLRLVFWVTQITRLRSYLRLKLCPKLFCFYLSVSRLYQSRGFSLPRTPYKRTKFNQTVSVPTNYLSRTLAFS